MSSAKIRSRSNPHLPLRVAHASAHARAMAKAVAAAPTYREIIAIARRLEAVGSGACRITERFFGMYLAKRTAPAYSCYTPSTPPACAPAHPPVRWGARASERASVVGPACARVRACARAGRLSVHVRARAVMTDPTTAGGAAAAAAARQRDLGVQVERRAQLELAHLRAVGAHLCGVAQRPPTKRLSIG
jgi:hypothetical protein